MERQALLQADQIGMLMKFFHGIIYELEITCIFLIIIIMYYCFNDNIFKRTVRFWRSIRSDIEKRVSQELNQY